MQAFTRQVITGVLTIIPLGVTAWILWFAVDMLIWIGRPATFALSGALRPTSPDLADLVLEGWFQSAVALVLALLFLYLLGRTANAVLGRRLLHAFDRLVEGVPFARTVYGATQTLIRSLGGDGRAHARRRHRHPPVSGDGEQSRARRRLRADDAQPDLRLRRARADLAAGLARLDQERRHGLHRLRRGDGAGHAGALAGYAAGGRGRYSS
jgi:hypothetical protein